MSIRTLTILVFLISVPLVSEAQILANSKYKMMPGQAIQLFQDDSEGPSENYKITFPTQFKTEEPAGQSRTEKKRYTLRDPDPSRMILSSTAFPLEKGRFQCTVHDLGFWMFKYNPSENITLQFNTLIPFVWILLNPSIKITGEISPHVRAGFLGDFYYLITYIEYPENYMVYYGGGPILTIGSRDYFINLASLFYGAYTHTWGDDTEPYGWNDYLALAEIGTGLRLFHRISFRAEYIFVIPKERKKVGHSTLSDFIGDSIFMYGFRYFGGSIFGELNLLLPIYDDMGEYLKKLPLGIPHLVFGINW